MNPDPQRLHQLFSACTDGSLTAEEHAELQERLRSDAAARRRWFAHQDIDCGLQDLVQRRAANALGAVKTTLWAGNRRPLLAAAAGLCIGLFSASVVFGFGFAGRVKTTALFQESFEAAEKLSARGKPVQTGEWGGDYAEIVGAHADVAPAGGQKMLRFLRADDELAHLPDSRSSDVFRLLDIRPFKNGFGDGGGVVRLSALFNAAREAATDPISCVLVVYALDARLVEETKSGSPVPNFRRRALAFSQSTRVKVDGNPASWQSAGNELRLPPETDYLLVQLGVSNDSHESGKRRDTFGYHYADQVRVTLARLPEVPLP